MRRRTLLTILHFKPDAIYLLMTQVGKIHPIYFNNLVADLEATYLYITVHYTVKQSWCNNMVQRQVGSQVLVTCKPTSAESDPAFTLLT